MRAPSRWRKLSDYAHERKLGAIVLRIVRHNGNPMWTWEVRVPMGGGSSGVILSMGETFDDLIADPIKAKRRAESKAREVLAPAVAALWPA